MSAADPAIFEGLYSFMMLSSDMAPMFRAGQRICVDPARPLEPGKAVVLFKADRSKFFVREFVHLSRTKWIVRKYGDDYLSGKCPHGTEEKLTREEWPIADVICGTMWLL